MLYRVSHQPKTASPEPVIWNEVAWWPAGQPEMLLVRPLVHLAKLRLGCG